MPRCFASRQLAVLVLASLVGCGGAQRAPASVPASPEERRAQARADAAFFRSKLAKGLEEEGAPSPQQPWSPADARKASEAFVRYVKKHPAEVPRLQDPALSAFLRRVLPVAVARSFGSKRELLRGAVYLKSGANLLRTYGEVLRRDQRYSPEVFAIAARLAAFSGTWIHSAQRILDPFRPNERVLSGIGKQARSLTVLLASSEPAPEKSRGELINAIHQTFVPAMMLLPAAERSELTARFRVIAKQPRHKQFGPQLKAIIEQISPAGTPTTLGLSMSEMRPVVQAHMPSLKGCYEARLKQNPSLKGQITFNFIIDEQGAVTGLKAVGTPMEDGEVLACTARIFQGIRFPKPRAGRVKASFPINFFPVRK